MKHVLVVAGALVVAGCGADRSAAPASMETGRVATAPAVAWEGVPELRPVGRELEVEPFRRFADTVDAEWEREPEAVVREFLGIGDGTFSLDGTRATLLREGLEDDSVAAERWVLELERGADVWTLVSARWEQRCHDGRGHATFGTELCL